MFAFEVITLKIAMEQIILLCYYLYMMVIPIDGTLRPESTLKRKSLSLCHHNMFREAATSGTLMVVWESGEENIANVLAKFFFGSRLRYLCGKFMKWPNTQLAGFNCAFTPLYSLS